MKFVSWDLLQISIKQQISLKTSMSTLFLTHSMLKCVYMSASNVLKPMYSLKLKHGYLAFLACYGGE